MEDNKIIELFFAREEQAISETDKKYGKLCFCIAKNIVSNCEDAEECVNDTYLGIWNSIPPTHPNNFVAYICKIVRNLSLKMLEYNSALKRSVNNIMPFSELEEMIPDDSFTVNTDDTEIIGLINEFLWRENESSRNVFIRRYWFCDSVSELASRYSLSENTVKSMLFRTRKRLRDYLEKEGVLV